MIFTDKVSVSGTRRTADGYLVADVRCARQGIQVYSGAELGRPEKQWVRVYRPESEVFAEDSLRTYPYRPMTNDHPAEAVDYTNWKSLATGQTGAEVVRDGEWVRVPMILMDSKAISDFEAGKRELSMGYSADIEFTDGVTEAGEPYDAIQKNIRINHMAQVSAGRAGSQARIGDTITTNGGHDMADALRKLLVDGLTIETTEQGAQAIDKLTKQLSDAQVNAKTMADAHAEDIKKRDKELAAKDDEIGKLKGSQLTDAALDQRVKERADLIASATRIVDADYTGKSDADIRKSVVVAKLGDAAIAGKSVDYIDARFDILLEDSAKDPVRQHMTGQPATVVHDSKDNGQSEYENRKANAWKEAK